ncbi:hypothetical protein KIPB_004917 [Kipferlia bialata]|uniref:Uncharacterized protein n=1 Tax=Kipferlia bialata TaxID=797122 RepID=A0A9K3CW74_9EUKA|nr:hypothetical protein KIPB_004917 [Kipferlia bialata]|eukprot:g4917.t1
MSPLDGYDDRVQQMAVFNSAVGGTCSFVLCLVSIVVFTVVLPQHKGGSMWPNRMVKVDHSFLSVEWHGLACVASVHYTSLIEAIPELDRQPGDPEGAQESQTVATCCYVFSSKSGQPSLVPKPWLQPTCVVSSVGWVPDELTDSVLEGTALSRAMDRRQECRTLFVVGTSQGQLYVIHNRSPMRAVDALKLPYQAASLSRSLSHSASQPGSASIVTRNMPVLCGIERLQKYDYSVKEGVMTPILVGKCVFVILVAQGGRLFALLSSQSTLEKASSSVDSMPFHLIADNSDFVPQVKRSRSQPSPVPPHPGVLTLVRPSVTDTATECSYCYQVEVPVLNGDTELRYA